MSDAPGLVDLRAQLDRLEIVLRDRGCPPLPRGLTASQIEKVMTPVGHPLPIEVSTLFEWHDGFGSWQMPMCAPISLEVSVARTVAKREEVDAAAKSGMDIDPDVVWPRSWLMLCAEPGPGVVIDCALPAGEPSPILHPDLTDKDSYPQVVEPSLTQLVSTWLHLFNTGVYGWNPTTGLPTRNMPLPRDLRLKAIY